MRTFVNKPGVTFDADKTTVIFAEDINEIIETLQNIGEGGASVTVGNVAPESAEEGDLWYDTSTPVWNLNPELNILHSTQHTQYLDGVSNSEIYRYSLPEGQILVLSGIEVLKRGGGIEDSDFTVQVYDVTNTIELAVCNLNEVKSLSVESDANIVYSIRVSNATGTDIDACFTVNGHYQYES